MLLQKEKKNSCAAIAYMPNCLQAYGYNMGFLAGILMRLLVQHGKKSAIIIV
jgi:hypothetical protein